MKSALTPDRTVLNRFVSILFKHANPEGFVALRAFDDTKRDKAPVLIEPVKLGNPELPNVVFACALRAATDPTPAVFCPPLCTFLTDENARTDNLFEGLEIGVECDERPLAAQARLEGLLGKATLVKASGGEWTNPAGALESKLHLHWRLREPTHTREEHLKLREARKLAAGLVGADATSISIVHPIRWPGSIHRKGEPRMVRIVATSENELDLDEALAILREATGVAAQSEAGAANGASAGSNLRSPEAEDVAAAVARIPNEDVEWAEWNRIGMAIWAASGASESGRQAFHDWSAKAAGKYNRNATDARWKHYRTSPPTSIGWGTLFYLARKHAPGWTPDAPIEDEAPTAGKLVAKPFVLRDPKTLPLRQWIYGNHLIRKFASATIAHGGAGKSSLIIAELLAIATGKPLLGVKPPERARVWLWNGEDPMEELERRIGAACLHFGIGASEIEGWLFVNSGRDPDSEIVIATETRDGAVIARPMVEGMIGEIRSKRIDVLQIDPFISSHRVSENDNNAIDVVAKEWSRIADIASIAIDLAHHSRKTNGAEVTVEDGRGAVALINAVRSARVLNKMTEEEGRKAGVTPHYSYFKLLNGKLNLAPQPEKADWMRLLSVHLHNDPKDGSLGDSVGVVTAWKWPDPQEGVDDADFAKVAAVIRMGDWREDSQSTGWVGKAVARGLGLDLDDLGHKTKVRGLIKLWLLQGRLRIVSGYDDRRRMKDFIQVVETGPDEGPPL